ncbi:hypothetical protein BDV36DRAFT_293426 [Aspergillus pseudocaelatus]|uniref:Uncharacterized protein n=1 Tax=Aspergillus pseudocaelatus TaxID=1825620 RepID=A0ABQ6WT97_9EURO|nr:hypothetical protein BDV36DRAFT_293426 [Aspergillus pseudocaelatus]
MSETYEIIGANVNLTSPSEDGTAWTVEQTSPELKIEYPEGHLRVNHTWGPLNLVDGYVDPNTFKIVVAPVVNQVYFGTIQGDLRDGLSVRFDLSSSRGQLRFFLKNGNEVWIDLNMQIQFGGYFERQWKFLSI